nr:MAG TPA: hypothetical protein [Bacteriophage sp.]
MWGFLFFWEFGGLSSGFFKFSFNPLPLFDLYFSIYTTNTYLSHTLASFFYVSA